MIMTRDGYEIDDDPARLDLAVVHGFVAGSYWAAGVPRDVVARSVANSLNLGLYHGADQVGFTARSPTVPRSPGSATSSCCPVTKAAASGTG